MTDSSFDQFEDPLENYDTPAYEDDLERALSEETVLAIQSKPFASVAPDTPIHVAVEKLASLGVACLLIEEEGDLVGVFSDRDVLNKVALEYEAIRDRPVSEVMTVDPIYLYETDSAAAALSVMAVSGYRHVPMLDVDDKLAGIISPQRVTAFLQEHYDTE